MDGLWSTYLYKMLRMSSLKKTKKFMEMNVYLQRTNINDFKFWRLIWDIILKNLRNILQVSQLCEQSYW